MAIQVRLVRHGEAEAGWDTDPDPGLSAKGRLQATAVRERLLDIGPLPILSSPLRRTLQTAAPLANAWKTNVAIEPVFREIPSPPNLDLQGRLNWLLSVRNQNWSQADPQLLGWRAAILHRLQTLQSSTVIFTHFMVLNLVAGAGCGNSALVHYQPANGSVLTIAIEHGFISVLGWGQQAESNVL